MCRAGRLTALSLLVATLLLAGCGASKPAIKLDGTLLLGMGDSLSTGVQPDATGKDVELADSYPALAAKRLKLTLAQYGCGGATTSSVINGGGTCAPARRTPYGMGSQLVAAEKLLRAGQVAVVTIDIGGNDLNPCLKDVLKPDVPCLGVQTRRAVANVKTIALGLEAAARAGGRRTRLVFVPIHDPYLAAWLLGGAENGYARGSQTVIATLNRSEAAVFAQAGFEIAPTPATETTASLDGPKAPLAGRGLVPAAVARLCAISWACAAPPQGPNIHLNDAGQKAFSDAVLRAVKG